MTRLLFAVPLLFAFALSGLLTACATFEGGGNDTTNRLVVQYATLKLIEQSDTVTAATIIEHVDRAQELLDSEQVVSLDTLIARVDLTGLDPSDRLLVSALFANIESAAIETPESDRLVRLREVTEWVRQAAGYANPDT